MNKKRIAKYLRSSARLSVKSGCQRAKRGTVIVRGNNILVKAFNSVYPTNSFCKEKGCLRDKLRLGLGQQLEKCRSIHAEALAICRAAKKGISLEGATAFITSMPCINCAKLILAAGIKEVFYLDTYGDKTGEVFLKKMRVKCQRFKLNEDNPGGRLRSIEGQK